MSVKQAIILPRVSEKTRQKCRVFVMYAELVGNYKKYGIKSLYDNKMMLNWALDRILKHRLNGNSSRRREEAESVNRSCDLTAI